MPHAEDPRLARLLPAIESGGGAVDVHPPDDAEHRAAQAWLGSAFPFARWGRVDWAKVPGHTCLPLADTGRLVAKVAALLEELAAPGGRVWVMWNDGGLPALRLSADALAPHLEAVVMLSWDTWIFDPGGGWCIESWHEDELCWGRAPAER